jgi:streptogramin lyase
MPVTRIRPALAPALLALGLAAVPAAARAQLVFDRAIYQDDKEGALRYPEGVACNDSGTVVVADTGNGRLLGYVYRDGVLTGGVPMKPEQLAYPTRVQIDSKGNIWVLDQKARKIVRLDAKGAFVGALEVKAGASIASSLPVSFKLDAADDVYALDVVARRVVVMDPSGTVKRQLELPKGKGIFTDLHVDSAGTVYVVDGVNASVWAVEKGGQSFRALTQPMEDKMNFPVYITGVRGKLYVVDQNGNGIVVLGTDGSYQGRQLAIGWSDGLVYYPSQLCVNGKGEAFVADRSNHRVQVFSVGGK